MKTGDKVKKKEEWISHKARHPWKPGPHQVGILLHNIDGGQTWMVQWPSGNAWEHEDNLEVLVPVINHEELVEAKV